jgi:DNA-binding transcriptional MerR regulator
MLNIPNKSLFKMNEVCGLTGVKPYVLRFWESEFIEIDPVLSSSGQKLYEHKDIEAVALIKKMLFDDKLNVEQAKMELGLKLASSKSHNQHDDEDSVSSDSDVPAVIARMSLSENDIKGLDQAKLYLKDIVSKTSELQQVHNWQ